MPEVALIELSERSSTFSIATFTTSPLIKSLFGLIVIIFLSEFIDALNPTGEPSDVYSRVIKLPTFELVISESSVFLTASLKVRDTFDDIGTQFEESGGTKATVGAVSSAAVNVIAVSYTHLTLPTILRV